MASRAVHLPPRPISDQRGADRDEVSYRTQMTGAQTATVHVVNISSTGLMARTEAPVEIGARVSFRLPAIRTIDAEVVWALGGRIGARFLQPVGRADYLLLLAELLKRAR